MATKYTKEQKRMQEWHRNGRTKFEEQQFILALVVSFGFLSAVGILFLLFK